MSSEQNGNDPRNSVKKSRGPNKPKAEVDARVYRKRDDALSNAPADDTSELYLCAYEKALSGMVGSASQAPSKVALYTWAPSLLQACSNLLKFFQPTVNVTAVSRKEINNRYKELVAELKRKESVAAVSLDELETNSINVRSNT